MAKTNDQKKSQCAIYDQYGEKEEKIGQIDFWRGFCRSKNPSSIQQKSENVLRVAGAEHI